MADDGLMAFAGLTERWRSPDGDSIESCTIVTTEACPALTHIHHRMPVILDTDDFDTWLSGDRAKVASVMHPYNGARDFKVYPVSKRVNNVRNDDATILQSHDPEDVAASSAETPQKADQLSLF